MKCHDNHIFTKKQSSAAVMLFFQLPEWPLLPATPACSRWTQFLHFTRIMWSFSGKFKAPIVAMIPDGASAKVEAGLSTFRRPSLLMFSSETVVRIGLPDANDGGIMSWIDTAWYESLLYTGHRLTTEHYLPITQGEVPHRLIASNHSSTRPRFNVLVILEGSNDSVTAHIFQDVANIVKHGIDSLGYQARITFCANLATDYCFDEEEHLIALAAHNLASFFSSDGLLAVLQGNLLPRRAGEPCLARLIFRTYVEWDGSCKGARRTNPPLLRIATTEERLRLITWCACFFHVK